MAGGPSPSYRAAICTGAILKGQSIGQMLWASFESSVESVCQQPSQGGGPKERGRGVRTAVWGRGTLGFALGPQGPALLPQGAEKLEAFVLEFRSQVFVLACSVAQLCPILCDPIDCSPPGSSVHGILQAKILKQIALSSSRGSFQPRDGTRVS